MTSLLNSPVIVFAALSGLCCCGPAFAQPGNNFAPQTVRVSVFGLFRPRVLRLWASEDRLEDQSFPSKLEVEVDGRDLRVPARSQVFIELASNGRIRVSIAGSSPTSTQKSGGLTLRVNGDQANRTDATFWLEVPGKLRRRFSGSLEVRSDGQVLEAIVTMPLETAVASVVQAESPPGAPMEALKAQAVASRSFLVARQAGHVGFDFCDTTHCQFLRSPPAANSPAAIATRATAGTTLTFHDESAAINRTLAAMYARSCGGRTRTLREIGVADSGYPYYAVRCVYCSRHPEHWLRDPELKSAGDSSAEPRTEKERLAFNRVHGWSALPSLAEAAEGSASDSVSGRGIGHGLGLCQLGAADMARHGVSFAQILMHYYPNTRLTTVVGY